jgi:hypothetical protein
MNLVTFSPTHHGPALMTVNNLSLLPANPITSDSLVLRMTIVSTAHKLSVKT